MIHHPSRLAQIAWLAVPQLLASCHSASPAQTSSAALEARQHRPTPATQPAGAGAKPSGEPKGGPNGTPDGKRTGGFTATGRWHTELDSSTGRFVFVDPEGTKRVLKGATMTGMESGTPGTAAGAGFWMYDPGSRGGTAAQVIENVVQALDSTWSTGVVRVPICGSAWATPYMVHDWGNQPLMDYRQWVDVVVKRLRALGRVVILDLHLWQIAPLSSAANGPKRINDETGKPYTGRVDGCIGYQKLNGKDTCASSDWVVADPMNWTCTAANAEGVTLQNAHYNRENIAKMWADVARRYKDDSGVFFELYNEPYEQIDTGAPFGSDGLALNKVFPAEDQYDWQMWATVMNRFIKAVRDEGGADNVVIVNGLMWGYTFHGPIAAPAQLLPWTSAGYRNIAYGFHPYQHGTCCGEVGTDQDLSKDDPFEATYCRYFKQGKPGSPQPSGTMLPTSKTCATIGYEPTRPMGMPPCEWVPQAFNPAGGTGLCVGQPDVCEKLSMAECMAVDPATPAAGGWSRYVLPMAKYGPLIATEFGSFDCSSPFVRKFTEYSNRFDISYTAWALWPQNNGGTLDLGMCSYPGITEPFPDFNPPYDADFKVCTNLQDCIGAMSRPMRWSGQVIFQDLKSNVANRPGM